MNLRERFQDAEHIVGSWVVFEDSSIAELLAEYHYDFMIVDMEHSTNGISTVNQMGQAIDAASGPTEMVVRVPWNDQVQIKRVLDVGASGILVPMIETVEEAEAVVQATRYPPEGVRGVGPLRAAYGREFVEYVSSANEEILVLVQIETATGVDNVEDIAAVDGIDGLFVGPSDLSVSLGTFGEDGSKRFDDAVRRIIDAAHDAGLVAGTVVGSPSEIEPWLNRGVDYLSVGSDIAYLNVANERFKNTFEEALEK